MTDKPQTAPSDRIDYKATYEALRCETKKAFDALRYGDQDTAWKTFDRALHDHMVPK